ncbi:MAG: hypothetical protein K6G64_08405 [Eubacterium sp.]|nr:hypothetical protein [Eubacterium sp.]
MARIYNVIADLCAYIIESCTEDFFVMYSCLSVNERQRIEHEINDKVPILFDEEEYVGRDRMSHKVIHKLTHEDMDEEFFEKLDIYSSELRNKEDYFGVCGLVQTLDAALKTLLLERIAEFQEDDFSVVLNTNREATGIGLLPRCSCVWERKHRLSHSYNRMDNFLFNILLMENNILGELIDRHFFLTNDLFPNFATKKSLKVAATALRLSPDFTADLYEKDRVQYFSITYDEKDFEKDNATIWEKILDAAENESDIIVFPEMLGNPEMTKYIGDKLKALTEVEREKVPSMIILPSYWENKRNTVTIMNRNGDVICKQCKQNPFRIEAEGRAYLEGIIPSMVINIFHFEGIGRIAILICKDFLTTKYMEQLMRCFKLTLIIVPSFSTGSYDFRQSFDLCAHDDCNVVWINTCASMVKGKEANFENIGYVRKRISRTDDEAQMLCGMKTCPGAFTGECNHDCMYYNTMQGV